MAREAGGGDAATWRDSTRFAAGEPVAISCTVGRIAFAVGVVVSAAVVAVVAVAMSLGCHAGGGPGEFGDFFPPSA